MTYCERAFELKEQIVTDRRTIHKNPELGDELPQTYQYVTGRLNEMKIPNRRCGKYGVVGLIGSGAPVIMLRADMDALPMPEESGLDFASQTKDAAHTCGHDCHTAMLLCAARMLKENEDRLCGTVKLVFQPGEETASGALSMVSDGVLENPRPDAVLAQHIDATLPLARIMKGSGYSFAASDTFDIIIHGKSIHAARPQLGVDPTIISAQIIMAAQTLISREATPGETNVISITSIETSTKTYNVIPEALYMKGTYRSYNEEQRILIKNRLVDICQNIGKSFRADVEVNFQGEGLPAVYCTPSLTEQIVSYTEELFGKGSVYPERFIKVGSEDFVFYSSKIPSSYFFLGAGIDGDTPAPIGQHNSKLIVNEEILPIGAAFLANAADRWLAHNQSY